MEFGKSKTLVSNLVGVSLNNNRNSLYKCTWHWQFSGSLLFFDLSDGAASVVTPKSLILSHIMCFSFFIGSVEL